MERPTKIMGPVMISSQSITWENDTRQIITLRDIPFAVLFRNGPEPIDIGTQLLLYVEDDDSGQLLFTITEVKEYLIDPDADDPNKGLITILRVAGWFSTSNARFGSLPEIPITTGTLFSYNTALIVKFNAAPQSHEIIRGKFFEVVHQGILYRLEQLMQIYGHCEVSHHNMVEYHVGYIGVYTSKVPAVAEDMNIALKLVDHITSQKI